MDTSDWMRNGDYTPTRIDAQYDAATILAGAKINSNPENTVGIIAYGGKQYVHAMVLGSH
jgi:26S proteasome regulatory subunit N10